MKVAVIGLGKLGAPMALTFAGAGHQVYCYDNQQWAVEAIRSGKALPLETDIHAWWKSYHHNIHPCHSVKDAVVEADFVFVIVPTPSSKNDTFDPARVLNVVTKVGKACQDKTFHTTVVVASTLTSGDSDKLVIPLLQDAFGHQHWGYCYSPEFIALGNVFSGLTKPDLCLIGSNCIETAARLEQFYYDYYEQFTGAAWRTAFVRTSPLNAELAKLALNCALTVKIGYANAIAEICDNLGANPHQVLDAVGQDSRIGHAFLKPGTPSSGPCLPRDIRCLVATARSLHIPSPLMDAIQNAEGLWVENIAASLAKSNPAQVAILGVAYKPKTHVTEESIAIKVAELLAQKHKLKAVLHDPAKESLVGLSGLNVTTDMESALNEADAVLIATPHELYSRGLNATFIKAEANVIDPWGAATHLKVLPNYSRF